ncbi:MAG: TatD family hydrolase [Candidatus Diapherotrites archaeon]
MFVDAHCHLDWFRNPEKVVSAAEKAQVGLIISNSTDLDSMRKNLSLAEEFEIVSAAGGIHPKDMLFMEENEIRKGIEFLKKNLASFSAVGEVGLDYKHAKTKSQKELQEKYLQEFISLAMENKKPLIVHSRYSDEKLLEILEKNSPGKVLMHWFNNKKESIEKALDLGYFISAGPIILSDKKSSELTKLIPLESLLLETDAPVEFGGKAAEPSWIPKVAEKVAEIHGIPLKEIEETTSKNSLNLFPQE